MAATLLHDPTLLIIDEPTAGIDPLLRARFWDYFRTLRDTGHTLIISTQYVTEAEYCDEVVVLRGGSLVAAGTPASLRRLACPHEVDDGITVNFEEVFVRLMERELESNL